MNNSLRVSMLISIFAAWLSSALIDFRKTTIKIQPRNEAFSIWIPVFSLLAIVSYKIGDEYIFEKYSAILIVISIYLLVLWSFAASKQKWYLSTAILLTTSMLCWVGCYRFELIKDSDWGWLGLVSVGIYVGWLGVATALNFAIIFPALDQAQTLLILATIISALSVLCKQPFACLSVIWAVLLQKETTYWQIISGILTVVGGCISYSYL